MSRIMLIEIADTNTEDAINAVLSAARDFPKLTNDEAACAIGWLATRVEGVKVLYSTPVGS